MSSNTLVLRLALAAVVCSCATRVVVKNGECPTFDAKLCQTVDNWQLEGAASSVSAKQSARFLSAVLDAFTANEIRFCGLSAQQVRASGILLSTAPELGPQQAVGSHAVVAEYVPNPNQSYIRIEPVGEWVRVGRRDVRVIRCRLDYARSSSGIPEHTSEDDIATGSDDTFGAALNRAAVDQRRNTGVSDELYHYYVVVSGTSIFVVNTGIPVKSPHY